MPGLRELKTKVVIPAVPFKTAIFNNKVCKVIALPEDVVIPCQPSQVPLLSNFRNSLDSSSSKKGCFCYQMGRLTKIAYDPKSNRIEGFSGQFDGKGELDGARQEFQIGGAEWQKIFSHVKNEHRDLILH